MTLDEIDEKANESWESMPQLVKDTADKATFKLAYNTGYLQCLEDKYGSVE